MVCWFDSPSIQRVLMQDVVEKTTISESDLRRQRGPSGCYVLVPLKINTYPGWWFGTFLIFPIILGMSSSQLTNSIIFQRGRYTTNQYEKHQLHDSMSLMISSWYSSLSPFFCVGNPTMLTRWCPPVINGL